jgi:fucose 4-O-acetylase-like acetyltransferase
MASVRANPRDRRVDALKGLAIVCVVFFHAAGQYFSYSPSTGVVYYPWAVYLRAFLFSFMLPLFAFLSGYVLGRPGGFKPREFFVKRTLGLLVPYFVWESVYGPGKDKHPEMLTSVSAFIGYYGHVLLDPHYEGRMWYLYVLWLALMFLGLARLKGDSTWVIVASIAAVFALGSFGQFHALRWVYVFVASGVLWRRYEERIAPKLAALGAAGAILFVPLWFVCEPQQVADARLAAWLGGASSLGYSAVVIVLPIVLGSCAVVAIVAASYRLPSRLEGGLAYFGVLSLGIYVTHFPFVEMWKGMACWFLPVNVAIALVIAVIATLLLGKWRPTATIFLGEPWSTKTREFGEVRTETL